MNGLTMLAYSVALTLGLLLSSPWWLLRLATTERYREGLRQRLGAVPYSLEIAVRRFRVGRRVVWVHAVSVGEVLAATRLVAELEAALGALGHDGWRVVVSTTTRTGQALARERFGAERVFYMPLDFGFAVRAYLHALRPAALILMESELWPRMLHECRHAGVPVAVVNARVSDRSFARAMRVRRIWGKVLRGVTLWLAQSEEDARRLVAMGAQNVSAIGNLKYDVRAPKQSRVSELIKEAAAGRPVIVGGSTLELSEDSNLINAQQAVPIEARPLLVLAPRHPDEFELVYSMAMEDPTLYATDLIAGKKAQDGFSVRLRENEQAVVQIIVLNTIGDLASVYGIADVAFVGGSLVKRGGHNPLEPAQFGIPVIMGPSFENFRDVVAKMQAADAICIVEDWEQLQGVVLGMLKDREAAKAMGERGRRVFEEQQGATARAVEAIVAMVMR